MRYQKKKLKEKLNERVLLLIQFFFFATKEIFKGYLYSFEIFKKKIDDLSQRRVVEVVIIF